MDTADLAFAGVARQAELIRAGEVSSRELVELYLARIARLDPELNAFRVVMEERALAEGDQADARRRAGDDRPLLGVPIAVKDSQDVAGEITTHGTVANSRPAQRDSEIVSRLRSAGAVIIGKTRLSELAIWPFTLSSAWGATRNPWDPERTPGGSSGGSGAATAAGLAAAGTASDGGGSIRIPAAYCGLFGLKPQRDRVSLAPDKEHWQGLSAAGFVTRTVLDTALLLDCASDPPEPFTDAARRGPGTLRVAVAMKGPALGPVSGHVKDAARRMADRLSSLGHRVEESEVPYGQLPPYFFPRWLRGIHEDADRMERPERLERRTRDMARLGSRVPGAWLRWSRKSESALAARLNRVFDDHDVVLTPHPSQPPLPIQRVHHRGTARTWWEAANLVAYDAAWNLTGQPACSVPAGSTPDGLPLSVQLVGRANDESTLISLAAQLESELRWPDHRPPVA